MGVELEKNNSISKELIDRFSKDFSNNPQQKVMMNAIKKNGINAVAMNQDSPVSMQYTFSQEITTGKITNQKQSGRCWMFAGLNTLRQHVIHTCSLESFELSQNYHMFWDKFEKANYFLESILGTLDEKTDSRLVSWLLNAPVQDGGQWEMFVNLVEKYGVVPKHVMPETFHSSSSRIMNKLLTAKLREGAAKLRAQKASTDKLRLEKEAILGDIYRMLCQFLGEPPAHFDFEYRDKDETYHRDSNLTPKTFFQKYIDINLNDYVSIINAPTDDKPFGRTYTVKYLGNVKGGKDILYLNIEIDELKKLALKQLEDNEPVWFGCDVGQMSDRDTGVMDTALYNYESALDIPLQLTKAERLDYGDSLMTHAMVLTGVNVVDGRPNRWKVENSWGKDPGKDGFFVMSDQWFDEFMYQIVVNKKHLSKELQMSLGQKPIELEPWDPMGSLA
ncbi:aminopeptidase C [Scopulibacillus darangshiensis]|uniref:Aminopeptidase n=1 Tax=Scopulibacillus darangshiensis TaxID=442528 RepID=A0A4R2NPY6_9BACL|nr:C1 family peptidase [Scopulibacillus darangshiensis]TCP23414.1 aminopeptidase C [Scopulibacillus darangshiensis]